MELPLVGSGDGRSCSLSPDAHAQRLADWQAVTAQAQERWQEGEYVYARYPRQSELIARLTELIAAEFECCSFMHFNVTEESDSVLVAVLVSDLTTARGQA